MNPRLRSAIWFSPAVAVFAPWTLVVIASLPSIAPGDWPNFLGSLPFLALWSFVIGYPIAMLHMVLAWPVYCLLRGTWWIAGAAGGVIGALPVTLLQVATVLAWGPDHSPDVAGGFAGLPLMFGASGVAGGLFFWWMLRAGESAEPQP